MTYVANEEGYFEPEYAEVYGVPFSFIPSAGSAVDPRPGPMPTRVRALEDRLACEITFPRLMGYRYELPAEKLLAKFADDSRMALSTADVPTKTELAPIFGEISIHTLDELRQKREQEVVFLLSKFVLERYFPARPPAGGRDGENNSKPWLFPQLLGITKDWLSQCVTCKDNTFPQLLLLIEFANQAAQKIYHAIVNGDQGSKRLMPILRPYDTVGSTRHVDFDTTRTTYQTRADKCHVSDVVLHSGWEGKMAQTLEDMEEVVCYVKNQNLGFTIPYTMNAEEHNYIPDFILRFNDGNGKEDALNLIIEVTGEKKKDKETKVSTATTLWVPAVNNNGGFGRWDFVEIDDPWNAINAIRSAFS
jgi:type III restriction enzyme